MISENVDGRVWKFGTDVDTDVILPSQYMRLPPEEYTNHTLEPLRPEFGSEVESGDIVVAEHNFGIGSSREHAAVALKRAGVGVIIAESFGRIFYRNAINQGLPALRAEMSVIEAINDGDTLTIDLEKGSIYESNREKIGEVTPLTGIEREIIEAGGAKAYYTS